MDQEAKFTADWMRQANENWYGPSMLVFITWGREKLMEEFIFGNHLQDSILFPFGMLTSNYPRWKLKNKFLPKMSADVFFFPHQTEDLPTSESD